MRSGVTAGIAFFLTVVTGSAAQSASDFRDLAVISATIQQVLELERTGRTVTWSNPETGHSGTVTARRTYFIDDRTPCREYTRTMTNTSGDRREVSGTGCRSADGRWKVDEEAESRPAPPPEPVLASRDPRSPAEPLPTEPTLEPSFDPSAAPEPLPERLPEDLPEGSSVEPEWSATPEPPAPPAPPPATARRDSPGPAPGAERDRPRETERRLAGRSEPPLPRRRPAEASRAAATATVRNADPALPSVSVSMPTRSEG